MIKRTSKQSPRTRPLAERELATATGGIYTAGGVEATDNWEAIRANKEWNDDWLAPKLTSGVGGLIDV
jgi:hypothetical protein